MVGVRGAPVHEVQELFKVKMCRSATYGLVLCAALALALWAFRLRTGWASDCRVQPRQTDAVDQFVAREANGYKAEGFSRQRVYINESQ